MPVDAPDELTGEVAPITMGHEFAGIVEKVGSAVTNYKVGVAPTFKSSIDVTRARGTVVIVSIFAHSIEWNPMQLTNTGVKVTSTIAYTPTSFQQTVDLMGTGQLKQQGIITSQIELDDIVEKGFEALTNDKSQAKILVKLSGEM